MSPIRLLTKEQIRILRALAERSSGSASLPALEVALRMGPDGLVPELDRLEDEGLVRHDPKVDASETHFAFLLTYFLTEQGRSQLRMALRNVDKYNT